ncbi:hypothetical protein C8258_16415 [Nocardia sp. MDA0666]|uniref:DUF1707 SHOCT-like domain-containing protein n=1 Tax=Nocardia sp. MDA0666 TaxID=2135448 RepID=UPI000D12CCAC|nr:DUF1707 domain-containing protein [Nocardia sp. MDA0666]PSR67208.1 hypothetical protein C8258_16415 [Nocardia sp. MDA0666]
MADSPDVRIGTAEREQAMQRLSEHFAAGRLSVAEFDERSGLIAAAVTRGDLAPVFGDLPAAVPEPPEPPEPAAAQPGGRREFAGPMMGLVVILALVLFFTTHTWLWFLLIPAVGIITGGLQQRGHDRRLLGGDDHRVLDRRRRRDRRRRF